MLQKMKGAALAVGISVLALSQAFGQEFVPVAEPVAAEPLSAQPQAVLACIGVGAGFFLIPGTETCLRVGGQVLASYETSHAKRDLYAETLYLLGLPFVIYDTVPPRDRPPRPAVESLLTMTTASMTDYGPLVSFLSLKGEQEPGMSMLRLEQAFISGAGFTVGRRRSFFDFSNGFNATEGYSSNRITTLAAYSHQVGERGQVTVSLEDNGERRVEDGVWALRGTHSLPDLVVAARVDDARWGAAQVSLAVQKLSDDRVTECCGRVAPKAAWAASAGVEYRTNLGGRQGRLLLGAAYAEGAVSYLGDLPFVTDYLVDEDGTISRTRGFSLIASYEHSWRDDLKSMATVSGIFAQNRARNLHWAPTGILASVGSEYLPAPGLRVGVEGSHYIDIGRARYFGIRGERSQASLTKFKTYVSRQF